MNALYQGKERKYDCLIPLEDRESIKEARYREMLDAADKILHLVAVISSYTYHDVGDKLVSRKEGMLVITTRFRGNLARNNPYK